MNNTISVIIPEGYEFKNFGDPILSDGGGALTVLLKKKQTKDFSFYVDEYLRSGCNTTNDMLCNWIDDERVIEKLKENLKQNKLQFVPWEVKIGLFKFICKDNNMTFLTAITILSENEFKNTWYIKLNEICGDAFIESLF